MTSDCDESSSARIHRSSRCTRYLPSALQIYHVPVELRQLEALIEIDERGSFSAAALALGTVQSNVSARIARLERELDTTLVDRGTGRLTEEGNGVGSGPNPPFDPPATSNTKP